ncbi:13762_t:CDS:2 [Entrophospora sp. SA101]|nr:13762_t:CDS:2 [Entrophospora sp. SA101]
MLKYTFPFLIILMNNNNNVFGISLDDNIQNNIDNYETISNNSNNTTTTLGDDKNAITDFYLVVTIGLLASLMNLLGSLYVIHRTYIVWKLDKIITLSLRMPFYIALTDAFLSFIHTINLSYTAANKTTWTQSSCAVIGGLVIILFAINALLVGIIAIATWLRVYENDNNEKESTLSPLPTFNTNKRNKPDLLTLRYTNLSHITVDFSNTGDNDNVGSNDIDNIKGSYKKLVQNEINEINKRRRL